MSATAWQRAAFGGAARAAEVVGVRGTRLVRVATDAGVEDAELAVPGYADAREGDRVLVLTGTGGELYVVGVLRALRAADAPDDDALHVEYDRVTERAVLRVPKGDLRLEVPAGAIALAARDGVSIDSERDVDVRSATGVSLRVEADRASELRLGPRALSIASAAITAATERAELVAGHVGLKADRVQSVVDRAEHVARVLEVRATRLVERTRDAYREVERLSQVRAGQLRWVAATTAQLLARDAVLKARDRMKLRGERIHLA